MRLDDDGAVEVVAEARDGLEALERIRALRPSIALVDLRMPAAGGIQVARCVRGERLGTRVLLVSACTEPAMVEAAREAGADGYVAKDVPGAEFNRVVRAVLDGAGFAHGVPED